MLVPTKCSLSSTASFSFSLPCSPFDPLCLLLLPSARCPARCEAMSESHEHAAARTIADWDELANTLSASIKAIQEKLPRQSLTAVEQQDTMPHGPGGTRDAFYIILPMLIVLSTFLFLLLLFLICVILLRRRRGIMLRDHDGPVDMSREDLIEGEGGFEGVESRWLETVSEQERRAYMRAKGERLTRCFFSSKC